MGAPGVATVAPHPMGRWALWLAAVASAAIVAGVTGAPPTFGGDVMDYLSMLEAWTGHGTPDLRPSDHAALEAWLRSEGHAYRPSTGFDTSPRGPTLGWHFWLYPLAALPARLALRTAGASELAAFQATNAVMFVATLWVVVLWWRETMARRLAFALLAAGSPVVAYLTWISPEVFTWSCVAVALVATANGRFGLGAALAACGSMQNPGAGAVALYAIAGAAATRRPGAVLRALSGASLGLLPAAINLWFFGVPSLVVAHRHARLGNVSLHRAVSLLADLDQGLLPHAPATLAAALAGLALAARRRDARIVALGGVLLFMGLSAGTASNWNSSCSGLMRYAVWMLPVLALLGAAGLRPARGLVAIATLGAAFQLALAFSFTGHISAQHRGRLASWVLTHAPWLYAPEHEIFVERQLHLDWVGRPFPLPIAVADAAGNVTKMLVDGDVMEALPSMYDVDLAWWQAVRTPGRARYLEPPSGAVRLHPPPSGREIDEALSVSLGPLPSKATWAAGGIVVRVRNRSRRPYWAGMLRDGALGIRCRVSDGAGRFVAVGRVTSLPLLAPDAEADVFLHAAIPGRPGRYLCFLRPFARGVAVPPGAPVLAVEREEVDAPPRFERILSIEGTGAGRRGPR